jgi:hypothetical protein
LFGRACGARQRLAFLRQVEHDRIRIASVPSGRCMVNVPSHLPVRRSRLASRFSPCRQTSGFRVVRRRESR